MPTKSSSSGLPSWRRQTDDISSKSHGQTLEYSDFLWFIFAGGVLSIIGGILSIFFGINPRLFKISLIPTISGIMIVIGIIATIIDIFVIQKSS